MAPNDSLPAPGFIWGNWILVVITTLFSSDILKMIQEHSYETIIPALRIVPQ